MEMRRREDAGRAGLVQAARKSGQPGQTSLSPCRWVRAALLPTDAGRTSAHSCHLEKEYQRLLGRKKGPGPQAPAWRASARQGETG
jgi:hypothetical protein